MHDALLAVLPNILVPTLPASPTEPEARAHHRRWRLSALRRLTASSLRSPARNEFVERVSRRLPRGSHRARARARAHQRPVVECLERFFASKTLEACLAWLAELHVCYAPVNTLLDALDDPNVTARGVVQTDERGRRYLAPPARFTAEPARPALREPRLGEHTDEVLASLDGVERRRV